MTQFSRKTQFSLSNIVAAGHPPVIHSMDIGTGSTSGIEAGTPLLIGANEILAWAGADVLAEGYTLGIALNTPMDGDGSVLVLLHGSYRMEAITIASAGLTQDQAFTLMRHGLYPEDSWGV